MRAHSTLFIRSTKLDLERTRSFRIKVLSDFIHSSPYGPSKWRVGPRIGYYWFNLF